MENYKPQKVAIKFSQNILLLTLLTLLAFLLIFEANKIITNSINNLNTKKVQKLALEERIKNLNKLDSEYKAISQDVNLIDDILPKQDKLIDTISKIEKYASDNKLELTTKFEGEPANHKLAAKFSVKGYYSDVMKFFNSVSTGDILIYVKALDISDTVNMLDNARAEFTTEVYFD